MVFSFYVAISNFKFEISNQCPSGKQAGVSSVLAKISVYVLAANLKEQSNFDLSLYTILQTLSLTFFEKAVMLEELTEFTDILEHADTNNQLKLFDY